MRISAILATKGSAVVTIGASASVSAAVEALSENNIGALVVSPDGQRIDGIVSERDVVRGLAGAGAALLDGTVSEIMSSEVQTCSPDEDTESLAALMTKARIRHVPVIEGGKLCGLISIGDVVKGRIAELEKDRHQLFEYIGAR